MANVMFEVGKKYFVDNGLNDFCCFTVLDRTEKTATIEVKNACWWLRCYIGKPTKVRLRVNKRGWETFRLDEMKATAIDEPYINL